MLRPHWLYLLAALTAVGCGKCGSDARMSTPAPISSASSPSSAPAPETSDASTPAAVDAREPQPADLPEVKDDGNGRATAALRAILLAYGIAVDALAIERECKVDEDGASIDDLEDVAVKHGLEAGTVVAPVEHVLLPAAKLLPAIAILDTADGEQEFVALWRIDGERVLVMDPLQGKRWVPRAELQKKIHVHEMTTPLDEYREGITAAAYQDALEARLAAIGVAHAPARALLDKARAQPDRADRGIGALDAAIRKVTEGGGSGLEAVSAAFACAFDREGKACDGVTPPLATQWSAQPAPNDDQGTAQVKARGAVLLTITGRSTGP